MKKLAMRKGARAAAKARSQAAQDAKVAEYAKTHLCQKCHQPMWCPTKCIECGHAA
jgi:hypothetical protein